MPNGSPLKNYSTKGMNTTTYSVVHQDIIRLIVPTFRPNNQTVLPDQAPLDQDVKRVWQL